MFRSGAHRTRRASLAAWARNLIAGLTRDSTRAHLARAAPEGIAPRVTTSCKRCAGCWSAWFDSGRWRRFRQRPDDADSGRPRGDRRLTSFTLSRRPHLWCSLPRRSGDWILAGIDDIKGPGANGPPSRTRGLIQARRALREKSGRRPWQKRDGQVVLASRASVRNAGRALEMLVVL